MRGVDEFSYRTGKKIPEPCRAYFFGHDFLRLSGFRRSPKTKILSGQKRISWLCLDPYFHFDKAPALPEDSQGLTYPGSFFCALTWVLARAQGAARRKHRPGEGSSQRFYLVSAFNPPALPEVMTLDQRCKGLYIMKRFYFPPSAPFCREIWPVFPVRPRSGGTGCLEDR